MIEISSGLHTTVGKFMSSPGPTRNGRRAVGCVIVVVAGIVVVGDGVHQGFVDLEFFFLLPGQLLLLPIASPDVMSNGSGNSLTGTTGCLVHLDVNHAFGNFFVPQ